MPPKIQFRQPLLQVNSFQFNIFPLGTILTRMGLVEMLLFCLELPQGLPCQECPLKEPTYNYMVVYLQAVMLIPRQERGIRLFSLLVSVITQRLSAFFWLPKLISIQLHQVGGSSSIIIGGPLKIMTFQIIVGILWTTKRFPKQRECSNAL